MKKLGIQVVRKNETEGLAYVQKHIDLGWEAISKFNLGDEVYFINLVWNLDPEPLYPHESQLDK